MHSHRIRAVLLLAAALVLGVAMIARPESDTRLGVVSDSAVVHQPAAQHATATSIQQPSREARQSIDEYRPLLAMIDVSLREAVLELLHEREAARLAGTINHVREVDTRIEAARSPQHYQLFEQLRDADRERAELVELQHQLASVSSLSMDQQDALLLTRLKYKPAFNELSGPAPLVADAMERAYRNDIATEALDHVSHAFLEDARAILDEQQWFVLAEREAVALEQRRTHLASAAP